MKVRTDSWHYRMIRFWGWRPSPSLCGYFWQAVFASLSAFGMGSMLSLMAGTVLYAFVVSPIAVYFSYFIHVPTDMLGRGLFILAFELSIALVTSIGVYLGGRRRKPGRPALVGEYLRAKKEKVCPTIEFVWEDKQQPEGE